LPRVARRSIGRLDERDLSAFRAETGRQLERRARTRERERERERAPVASGIRPSGIKV